MKENTTTKPTKKRRLLFWLVIAACLLIVAAITVGVIFGVRGNMQNLTADSGTGQTPGDTPSKPDEGDDGDDDDGKDDDEGGSVDTSTMYEFQAPVETVTLIKSHEFGYDKTMDWYRLHQAMDFGAPAGTEVFAAVDGTVKSIVTSDMLDYAIIEIEHAGDITTVYKFIDPASGLKAGQKVSRGQVIGTVAAASGRENADGDHLHFEVFKAGKIQDPDDYLHITSK